MPRYSHRHAQGARLVQALPERPWGGRVVQVEDMQSPMLNRVVEKENA